MAKTRTARIKPSDALNRNWTWLLGLGILFVLLGIIGLGTVVSLSLISIFFLGIIFAVAGVVQFADVFQSIQWKAAVWHGVVALVYLIMSGLIIYDPILASSIVTLLIAWGFIGIGTARFIMAITLRGETQSWIFLLISSLAAIILGVLIIMQWPASGLWVIGLFISIELLVNGWTYVFISMAMHKALRAK